MCEKIDRGETMMFTVRTSKRRTSIINCWYRIFQKKGKSTWSDLGIKADPTCTFFKVQVKTAILFCLRSMIMVKWVKWFWHPELTSKDVIWKISRRKRHFASFRLSRSSDKLRLKMTLESGTFQITFVRGQWGHRRMEFWKMSHFGSVTNKMIFRQKPDLFSFRHMKDNFLVIILILKFFTLKYPKLKRSLAFFSL